MGALPLRRVIGRMKAAPIERRFILTGTRHTGYDYRLTCFVVKLVQVRTALPYCTALLFITVCKPMVSDALPRGLLTFYSTVLSPSLMRPMAHAKSNSKCGAHRDERAAAPGPGQPRQNYTVRIYAKSGEQRCECLSRTILFSKTRISTALEYNAN